MKQMVDIQQKTHYSGADTGPNRAGLFARVSAGKSFRKVGAGWKLFLNSYTLAKKN